MIHDGQTGHRLSVVQRRGGSGKARQGHQVVGS